MNLSARVLKNVANVNSFDYSTQLEFSQGEAVTVYLQLIDRNKDVSGQGFNPPGRRYVPTSGAALRVAFGGIECTYFRDATQPFDDPSIWAFPILATDKIRGTISIRFRLAEGEAERLGSLPNVLHISAEGNL